MEELLCAGRNVEMAGESLEKRDAQVLIMGQKLPPVGAVGPAFSAPVCWEGSGSGETCLKEAFTGLNAISRRAMLSGSLVDVG